MLRIFRDKNWTLTGVKTVLSKIDATGSVKRSGSGQPRTAPSPDVISDMAAKRLDLNFVDYRVWGSYKSLCTTTTGSRT